MINLKTRSLLLQIKSFGLLAPETEFKFHPKRRWRFDMAYPDIKLAIEIEGGIWINGRHSRGKGFENDCIKYQEAMLLGWDIYRTTYGMITSGMAIDTIIKLIELKNNARINQPAGR